MRARNREGIRFPAPIDLSKIQAQADSGWCRGPPLLLVRRCQVFRYYFRAGLIGSKRGLTTPKILGIRLGSALPIHINLKESGTIPLLTLKGLCHQINFFGRFIITNSYLLCMRWSFLDLRKISISWHCPFKLNPTQTHQFESTANKLQVNFKRQPPNKPKQNIVLCCTVWIISTMKKKSNKRMAFPPIYILY
jgi:hypothetical protein